MFVKQDCAEDFVVDSDDIMNAFVHFVYCGLLVCLDIVYIHLHALI